MIVLRVLFWTWFAVSAVILLYRLGRRVATRRQRRLATSGLGVAQPVAPTPQLETPQQESAPAAPEPEPEPVPMAPEPTVRSEVPADRPAVPPVPPAAVGGRARTIAQMVTGIQMPADLVPYPGAEPRPGAIESVAFLTSGHPAEAIGQATETELQRLGFRTHALAGGEVLATRGDDELKVAVHPRPASVAYGGLPAFPLAQTGSVVVEIWRD